MQSDMPLAVEPASPKSLCLIQTDPLPKSFARASAASLCAVGKRFVVEELREQGICRIAERGCTLRFCDGRFWRLGVRSIARIAGVQPRVWIATPAANRVWNKGRSTGFAGPCRKSLNFEVTPRIAGASREPRAIPMTSAACWKWRPFGPCLPASAKRRSTVSDQAPASRAGALPKPRQDRPARRRPAPRGRAAAAEWRRGWRRRCARARRLLQRKCRR
jgi:hypothetical protein